MTSNNGPENIESQDTVLPETRSFWRREGAGKAYDEEFAGSIGSYVNVSELKPIEDLVGSLKGLKIADVGCGTGRHLELLDPSNEVYGIDFSSKMLEEAAKKVPHGKFIVGSAEALPFLDGTFDIVISVRVLQHIRNQEKVVQELARVTKPGGTVILASYNSWSLLCLYKQIRMGRLGRILNVPFRALLGKRSFFNPWGFSYDNYCSIPEISRWMKKAGLEREKTWGATSGQPWFWNDFFIGKVLERTVRPAMNLILRFFLWIDRTLARHWPLKYFTDKIIVVARKRT